MALIFKDAEKARDEITKTQEKEIAKLYENWADEIGERAKFYSHHTTPSSYVSERQMKELQKMLRTTGQEVSKEIESKIKSNMYTISDAVVADNIKWLESFGFSSEGLNAVFNYVPDAVVRNLITGQIYDSGWSLSKRIWSDNEQTMKDAYQIMAKGLAENKSVFEIAKDLEKYVRPSAKLPWNPVLAMKNTKTGKIEYKRIYKNQVDYNAQRLARTLAQHSYQQSFLAATQKNPFITEYIWHSNGSRPCPLCLDRDGVTFQKDNLPMDHPNGMCTMEPVVAKDMIDQLANWFNSPDGTYPEIDAFASNFGYDAKKLSDVKTTQDFVNKYGLSTKSPNAWYNSLTQAQKAEAKMLKEQSGLNWNQWYEKNVHSTGDATEDFVKKYGTSTKSPNAWYNSLTPAQKAEAKALKDKSGLTWNDWYNKNVYAGSTPKTTTVKAFSSVQDKYLSPYGFSPSNMPKNFVDQMVDTAKVAKKVATTTKTTKATTSKVDDAFDVIKWKKSVESNNLRTMNSWTDDWLTKITSTEKSAVRTYTGSAYRDINGYLRGTRTSTSYEKEIKLCQKALSKASLPQETIVRRGSDYNMLRDIGLGNITEKEKSKVIGAIVEDKGFVSTSPSPHGGFSGSIEYVIKVPKGSQAMYVDSISRFQGEEELLINCGGKFIVEDIEFNGYGDVNKIYMTLKNLQ